MKSFILLFFTIIAVYSQEPPPTVRFAKTAFGIDSDIREKFQFTTHFFCDSIYQEILLPERLIKAETRIDDVNIIVNITGGCQVLPRKNDIVKINIKEKRTDKNMSLYIRLCHDMDFREIIGLENLKFLEGVYFYDMEKSNRRFEIQCGIQGKAKVNLDKLEEHATSLEMLNRILKHNR